MRPLWLVLALLTVLPAGCRNWNNPARMKGYPAKERATSETHSGVTVTVAVPTRDQTYRLFKTDLYAKGIQPVWVNVANRTDEELALLPTSIDPEYFSPNEAAYKTKGGFKKNGQWKREVYFQTMSLPLNLPPRSAGSGFVMTHLEKGTKYFFFDTFAESGLRRFSFLIKLPYAPGDYRETDFASLYPPERYRDLSLEQLRAELEKLPCCAPGRIGKADGDPVNLVIIGNEEETLSAMVRSGWREAEIKASGPAPRDPALAKRPHEYQLRTPLFLFDRQEDTGFYKPREEAHERNQFWLWLTPWRYQGKNIWVGTMSRDIGLRYYLNKPEVMVTPKIDSDVDQTRGYLLEDLLSVEAVERVGWVRGVGAATPMNPKKDSLGDHWYTDGLRLVLFISDTPVEIDQIEVLDWDYPPKREPIKPRRGRP